jgi:branched-subunit amino acid transport protein
METALKLWTVIFAVGALNYLSRLSFIALFARRAMPPLLARALKYVPSAMLTALILPMVIDWHGSPADLTTPRAAAALIATAVAFATRSTLATLGAGMAALWLLQWSCAC